MKKICTLFLSITLVLCCVTIPSNAYTTSSVSLKEGEPVDIVVSTSSYEGQGEYTFVAPKDGFYVVTIPAAKDGGKVSASLYTPASYDPLYDCWKADSFSCTLKMKAGETFTLKARSTTPRKLTVKNTSTASGKNGKISWSLNLSTGKLKVTGSGAMGEPGWTNFNEYIKSAEIGKGVTTVGEYAFAGSTDLTSIKLPTTITTIAYGAFDHCKSLKKVTLPSALKKIDTGAFIFCSSLSSVSVSGGANNSRLTSIGTKAFGDCTKLKSLTIPKGVTSIGKNAYGYKLTDDYAMTPTKLSGTKITGVKKTKAESYAKSNKITFKSIANNGKWVGLSTIAPTLTAKKKSGEHILTFSKVTGATGYQIYHSFSNNSNSFQKLETLRASKRSFTIAWVSAPKSYYKVRAYRKSGSTTVYGPFSTVKSLK